jgi:hypothetical protein
VSRDLEHGFDGQKHAAKCLATTRICIFSLQISALRESDPGDTNHTVSNSQKQKIKYLTACRLGDTSPISEKGCLNFLYNFFYAASATFTRQKRRQQWTHANAGDRLTNERVTSYLLPDF